MDESHGRKVRVELITWTDGLRAIGMSEGLCSHLESHRLPDEPEAEWAGPLEPPT
jgi:hypothetical protein